MRVSFAETFHFFSDLFYTESFVLSDSFVLSLSFFPLFSLLSLLSSPYFDRLPLKMIFTRNTKFHNRYSGLLLRFADAVFAWKFLAANVVGGCAVAFLFYMANHELITSLPDEFGGSPLTSNHNKSTDDHQKFNPDQPCQPGSERMIKWSEFLNHTCATKSLWLLIDGMVYDVEAFRNYSIRSIRFCHKFSDLN